MENSKGEKKFHLDYALIAKAEVNAGSRVHQLANILTQYKGSYNLGTTYGWNEKWITMFEDGEKELRQFTFRNIMSNLDKAGLPVNLSA